MPCMECEDTGRVECGQDINTLCTPSGGEVNLGVAYVPIGIGSLYLAVDVYTAKDKDERCEVYLVRHCPKQDCNGDDDGD